jgi:hypothetical protein
MKPFAHPPQVLEHRLRANIVSRTFKISERQEISYLHDAIPCRIFGGLSAEVRALMD